MIFNMWLRCCLALLIAGALQAQTQMSVEELVAFVKSELALKQHTDKQIAAGIRDVQLTEKLTDKTIIDLQALGLGQKTGEALKYLREQTANMKPPTHDSTSSPATATEQSSGETPTATLAPKPPPIPPPDSVRQQEIIQAMRDYALNYAGRLPNFFCVEVTRQNMDPNGGENYRSLGVIWAKVGYNEGRDYYNVYSINGKMAETTMDNVKTGGATSTGEFGSQMREIFEPHSQAEIGWDHWATLRKRRMAVFNYFIDSGHSSFTISYGGGKNDEQRIVTAYRGLIYADANTGEIDRIKFEAVDIPRSFPVTATTETLDYDLVPISGQQFVLPVTAKLYMKAGRENSKNEIEFRAYRKFDTEEFIKYNLDPNAAAVPDAGTQQKPPTTEQQKPATVEPATPATPGTPAPTTPPAKKTSPWVLPTADDLPPPPPR
jgi:hypothetical protein